MDTYVTGAAIKSLRESRGLTQSALAERIGVSNKAVSKWETGKGLPDLSLLQPLAQALGVSVTELMNGCPIANQNTSANLLRSKFYVCPVCGNVLHATGACCISCCGITLPPLEAEEPDEHHRFVIEPVEDEFCVLCGLCHHRPDAAGEALSRGQRPDPPAAAGTGISVFLLQPARTVPAKGVTSVKKALHGL